jgi:hypothetical protein
MKYYLHRPTGQIHRQAQQPFFNRQTAGNDLPIVQTKLSVSSPTDEHEKEADKTADKVMRMQEGATTPTPISPVQRKCDHCEEEEKKVPRKETTSAASGSFMAPPSVSKAVNRSGQPLESRTRSFMETRFGRQFGHVQVHTDGESAQSARDIQARAYTSGNHIVFADGQYQPHTEGGRHLLAHELTHVVQQNSSDKVSRTEWPWPLNGRVVNNFRTAVKISGDTWCSTIPANSASSRTGDIDFVKSPSTGIWYKISFHTATVDAYGSVSNISRAANAAELQTLNNC